MKTYKITFSSEFEGTISEAYGLFHLLYGVTKDDGDINIEKKDDKTTLTMDGVSLTVTYEPVKDG